MCVCARADECVCVCARACVCVIELCSCIHLFDCHPVQVVMGKHNHSRLTFLLSHIWSYIIRVDEQKYSEWRSSILCVSPWKKSFLRVWHTYDATFMSSSESLITGGGWEGCIGHVLFFLLWPAWWHQEHMRFFLSSSSSILGKWNALTHINFRILW